MDNEVKNELLRIYAAQSETLDILHMVMATLLRMPGAEEILREERTRIEKLTEARIRRLRLESLENPDRPH